jgi:hypothetical protein
MKLTQIEGRFLAHLSSGDHPVLAVLRQQLSGAEVADRKLTGAGVVVTLGLSAAVRRMPVDSPVIADVGFSHPEAPTGGAAALYVRQGYAHKLEIECYAESWPRSHDGFTLQYLRRPEIGIGLESVAERDMIWFADSLE